MLENTLLMYFTTWCTVICMVYCSWRSVSLIVTLILFAFPIAPLPPPYSPTLLLFPHVLSVLLLFAHWCFLLFPTSPCLLSTVHPCFRPSHLHPTQCTPPNSSDERLVSTAAGSLWLCCPLMELCLTGCVYTHTAFCFCLCTSSIRPIFVKGSAGSVGS